jgi:hypothetical protein
MLRIDTARWGQTPDDLRRLAVEAPHARSRERFLALYEITQATCATAVAAETARHHQTVMRWVHRYNDGGPDALMFVHTGGLPFFADASKPGSTQRSGRLSPLRQRRR